MLIVNQDYSVSFSMFKKFPQLICFMTTRETGVYSSSKEDLSRLYAFHGGYNGFIIRMNQVHGSKVEVVRNANNNINIKTDGLVTAIKQISLAVYTADCVPLFLYDPRNSTIGIVHAGWKGTLKNITKNAVLKLQDIGSDPKEIYVAIGPHIGGCCYNVESERAKAFSTIFQDYRVVFQELGYWHIDLGQANKRQLLNAGVLENHIDAPITCTSCQNDLFFSHRKDPRQKSSRMLGIIGIH